MNKTELKSVLEKLTLDIAGIVDPKVSAILTTLLNLVEMLSEKNEQLLKENQRLRDETNRLKGEQGKPDIRKQKQDIDDSENKDHSSENDRKERNKAKKERKSKNKKNKIKIDRTITIAIENKEFLPEDAIFKGHQTVVIQDLAIKTDNIEFLKEIYYSPSLKKTFIAPLPAGYQGEFGPGIRSLVITWYRDSGMTEPAIHRLLATFNIHIAKSTISTMITEGHEYFHQEKEDIINAGLKTGIYQHMDDTGCRVNGKNYYTHILCNPYFTAFFTRPKKDRLTLLEILCRGELKFEFNDDAYNLMSKRGLSMKHLLELKEIVGTAILTQNEIDALLKKLFPNPKKKQKRNRCIICEASAIVYYQNSEFPLEHLMTDDAPQFNEIAKHQSLCWIHDGRHYKKLDPIVMLHREALDKFTEQYWDYYHALLAYKMAPSETLVQELSAEFDKLFSTRTGYDALDDRICKTFAKKESLLQVLSFPFLPLHNNPAELGARAQARMRDINFQTISENGTKTKDTFATLVQTARKLSVNIYDYVYDRISKTLKMPSLAELIIERATITEPTLNTS